MRFHYYRVSSADQSIEAQRHALTAAFGESGADGECKDENVSGAVLALDRPGFKALFAKLRQDAGDVVAVYAVDRLGRDALDIQATVKRLADKGVAVEIYGIGRLEGDVGRLILAVMAQLAEMERKRIAERCNAGRAAARKALAETGRTQHGKLSLGRPFAADAPAVLAWRKSNKASIAKTAAHFKLSAATVKRYCAATTAS